MPSCVMRKCTNHSKKTNKHDGITYHRFPANKVIRQKWIDIVRRQRSEHDWQPTTWSTVCSNHFDPKYKYTTATGRMLFKKSAIPTEIKLLDGPATIRVLSDSDGPATFKIPPDMDETVAFKVCRICLVTEEAMYNISDHGLSAMYEQLTGSTDCIEDKLPQTLCCKCVDRLSSAHSFREMALKTKEILTFKFDVSKHTITLKDIQPISEQIDEIKKQDVKLSRVPKTVIVSGFENKTLKVKKRTEQKPKLKADLNDFTNCNDDEVAIDDKEVKDEVKVSENNDSKRLVTKYEVTISNDEIPMNDIKVKDEVIMEGDNEIVVNEYEIAIDYDEIEANDMKVKEELINENNDEMIYEYSETPQSEDNDDESDNINKKVKVKKINRTVKKNIKMENPSEVIKRYRSNGIQYKPNRKARDVDGFIITKLSYEEQIAEVEKRKESDAYKKAPYKCKSCFKGFDIEERYTNHIEIHDEKNGEFECFICKRRYKEGNILRKHLTGQHSMRFECKSCPFVSHHKAAAENHLGFHSGRVYKCPHCDAQFKQLSSYKGHLRVKHVCDYVCEWCGYTYISQHGLHCHKKSKHKMVDNMELNGPYCEVCDVTFVSDEAYYRHLKVSSKHTTDLSEVNRPRNSLPQAYQGKKLMKKIKCEQCGVILYGMSEYSKHFKKMHYGVKRTQFSYNRRFMCEHCGRRVACLALLKDHLLSHSGETHFSCDTCGKNYATKANLLLHVKAHTTVYKCPYCDKQFTHPSNKYRHIMMIHKQHKVYKCEYCDKAFKTAAQSKSHTEHIHHKKPWPKRHRNRINKPME